MADYRTDGGQVDYETTLELKEKERNNTGNLLTTSNEVYEKREREARIAQMEALLQIAGLGGAAYGTAILVNNNPALADLMASLPGANRYAEKHQISRKVSLANKANPVNLTENYKHQSFGRSVLSLALSGEELSPFGILKTLQLTNMIEPMVKISRESKDIKFTGSAIAASEEYYDSLIRASSKGKHKLLGDDLKHGFTLRDNRLFRNLSDGTIDTSQAVLDYVRPVTTHVKLGDSVSPNRPLNKFAQLHGTTLGFNTYKKEQMAFIAGSSNLDLAKKWASASLNQALEIGFKTMDNPIAGLEDLLKAGGLEATGLFDNKFYNKAKKLANIQFGTEGHYNMTLRASMGKFATNLGKKSAALYLGYQAVNQVLDMVTPDSSAWSDGLISGITTNYANVRVGLAKVFSDPFQRYKNAQEDAADGSTKISTLIGFPLAGAVLGGSLPYYKRLFDSATQGIEAASDIADTKTFKAFGRFSGIAQKLGLGATTSSKANAFKGALIGAAVALPFLPGALIGQSSTELKDRYSGKQLDENRANKYWLAGGSAWEGGQIKSYEASRVARILSGAKDQVLYGGDNDVKRDLDPLYSPIKYLRNPYAFEERHTEDMPYPVWGMNVDYGSFLGKMYQGTIGEVIKPTVINEKFLEDSRLLAQGSLENYRSNSFSPSGIIASTGIPSDSPVSNIIGSFNPKAAYQAFVDKSDILGDYPVAFTANSRERQMMDAGMMLREESPEVDPYALAASQTYSALTDFAGLKGFTSSLVIDKLGYDPSSTRLQLARSGTARSLADDIKEENLGDMFGLGEFQRRVVPTSASSRQNDVNPMLNSIAPSWMPRNEEKYFNDFSKGDYWGKVSHGEERLAGEGYAKLNQNLEGVNPEDYPLVYQYKILSDTAMGSPEQISMKEYLLSSEKDGKLSEKERDIFYTTLTQEQAKSRQKEFSEYKTPEEFSRLSLGGKVLNSIWETAAHNSESVLEPLTPFRPGAKFIHKRTAIEDYEKTMLSGPDTAIWTSPYSHFIRPTVNRMSSLLIPGLQKPIEAEQRDNVDEYFDKLEYLKARKNGRINDALRTVHGASYAGITDTSSFNKFRSGLSDNQKAYLESFSKETDDDKKRQILAMLPKDVAKGYVDIWNNLTTAENAKRSGRDVDDAIKTKYLKDSVKYLPKGSMSNDFARDLDQAVQDEKMERAINGKPGQMTQKDELVAKAKEMRLRAADAEAEQYIAATTGIPAQDWIGWDPRLKLDEVKLRTLQVGNADTYQYGYWDSDLRRNSRIIALDDENFVTHSFNDIRKGMRESAFKKISLQNSLMDNGLFAKRIVFSEASRSDLQVSVTE
jgi:hypothetical protein